MRKALEFVQEIKRKQEAIEKTNSRHLINDYKKSIKRDIKELKYYCEIKGIDYNQLMPFSNEFINKLP